MRVTNILKMCKNVSNLVRRSEASRDELKQACLITSTRFIYPVKPGKTRWNSTDSNLESCLKLQPALTHLKVYDRSGTWSETVPNLREFDIVKAVHQCLQPAKIATKTWELDRKASIHEVVKQLYNMKMALEDLANTSAYVKTFARNFLKQIQKRFKNCGTTSSLLNIAHFLDPSEKGCVLKVFGVYDQTIEAIKEMAKKYDPPPIRDQELDQTASAGAEEISRPLTGTERLRMTQRASRDTSDPLSVTPRVDIEIERYESLPLEECGDPLVSWRVNKRSFDILRHIAADVLSIPASSASSERAFSAATRVS